MRYLDVIQEALENGLQIIPYPIYSEPKHSVLVQKKALSDTVYNHWSMKVYKDFPSALGMQETHATIAAIQDVLKQIQSLKGNEMITIETHATEFVDHFCFDDFTGKSLTEAAGMLMALDNLYRSENIEVFFDLTNNGEGYAILGDLYKKHKETQEEVNERKELEEYKRLKAKFG